MPHSCCVIRSGSALLAYSLQKDASLVRSVIKMCFGEIHLIKSFVSRSFDLIEGHWECKKHAVMLGCLCKAL